MHLHHGLKAVVLAAVALCARAAPVVTPDSIVLQELQQDVWAPGLVQFSGGTRKLLHGCHRQGCSSQCPRCTFPRAGIATGHCQRRRRLFSCRRNRNDGDSGNEGNEGDEGNEGNEGDEGDEGNEGNEGDEGNMENWNSRLAMAPEGLLDEDYDEDYDEEVGEEYFYEFDDGTVREEGPEIVVMNKLGSFALDGDHDLLPEIAPEHEDPEYVDQDEETGAEDGEEEEEEEEEGDDDDTEGTTVVRSIRVKKTISRMESSNSHEADNAKDGKAMSREEMIEDD